MKTASKVYCVVLAWIGVVALDVLGERSNPCKECWSRRKVPGASQFCSECAAELAEIEARCCRYCLEPIKPGRQICSECAEALDLERDRYEHKTKQKHPTRPKICERVSWPAVGPVCRCAAYTIPGKKYCPRHQVEYEERRRSRWAEYEPFDRAGLTEWTEVCNCDEDGCESRVAIYDPYGTVALVLCAKHCGHGYAGYGPVEYAE